MIQQFLYEGELRLNTAAAVAATSAIDGVVVDMANRNGAVFFASVATANAGNYLKVQQGALADGSDMADLLDTKTVAAANGDVVAVEVYKPTKRYLRPVLIRAGASTAAGDLYQILTGARVLPVDNNVSSEIVSEVHVSPAEGTA